MTKREEGRGKGHKHVEIAIEHSEPAEERGRGGEPDDSGIEVIEETESDETAGAGVETEPRPVGGDGETEGAEASAAEDVETPEQTVKRLGEQNKALRKERDALYERWLRASADLDNYRKRVGREREEFRKAALESLFREIVHVLDNFDRALAALPEEAPKALADGSRLIHKQLLDLLARNGLVPMEHAAGAFDPHLHEAVETEMRSDRPAHEILDEIQKGYMIGTRVLRPALVKVSVRPDTTGEGPDGGKDAL